MLEGRNGNRNKLFSTIIHIEYCDKVFSVYVRSFIHFNWIDKGKNCRTVTLYRTIAHVYFVKMAIFINIAAFWHIKS